MKVYRLLQLVLWFTLIIGTYGCIDQEFDVPPGFQVQTEDISNTSIADLKASHTIGDNASAIADGVIIKGVVISDDTEGNFFRELTIQDETAGILIRLDQTDLSAIYGRGREVFINCEGLVIGDFNGLTQLGVMDQDGGTGRVPEIMIPDVVILGQQKEIPAPKIKKITDLQALDLSTLIMLENVELEGSFLGDTYAEPNGGSSRNRTIVDCDGNEVTLRSSDFAGFAGATIPPNNGSITAVFSIFGTTLQLAIRDTNDLNFINPRCDGSGGGGGDIQEEDISNMTIAQVLDLHMIGQPPVKIPAGTIIKGNVISSDEQGNFYRSLIIQDESAGVLIRVDGFDLFEDYPVGRKVYVDCEELYIADYNGLPQIGTDDGDGVGTISSVDIESTLIKGPEESPLTGSIKSISELGKSDLNTLVTVTNVEYIDSEVGEPYSEPDFSTNRTLQDCDGNNLIIRHSSFADFADATLPDGNGSITAVFGVFGSDYQLFIRDLNDVSQSGDRCDGTMNMDAFIDEDFELLSDFDPVSIAGWTNVSTTGQEVWQKRSFSGNGFAQASGFNSDDATIDAWLVTPGIDLSQNSSLSFESAKAFFVQDGLSVLVSSDFSGDVSSASWQNVDDAALADNTANDFDWVNSGVIDLSQYGSGTIHIAFRYQGDNTTNTSTFRIDNILVE